MDKLLGITLLIYAFLAFGWVVAWLYFWITDGPAPWVSVRTGGGNGHGLPFSFFYWLWEFKTFTVYRKRPFTNSEIDVILGYFDYVSTTSVQFDWFPEDLTIECGRLDQKFTKKKKEVSKWSIMFLTLQAIAYAILRLDTRTY